MTPLQRFAQCELRLPTRELWRGGVQQPLRRRVFDLLVLLVERRPATVTHAEIARVVWGQTEVRPSLIAQAVMQARRATGDDLKQPAIIVSVHGVGYRFGATVTDAAPHARADTPEPLPSELLAAVQEAEDAVARGNLEAAVFLVDQAIARAERAQARAEQAWALSLAARIALIRGTIQLAARHAYQALRMAAAEGSAAVLAKARLAVAQVEIAVSEHQSALERLEAAHAFLQGGGPSEDLRLCEFHYARACCQLHLFEASREWCIRCQQTARQLQPDQLALAERNLEVNILLEAAESARQDQETGKALAAYADALVLNEALRADTEAKGSLPLRMCWSGNRGQVLLGLGRVDEAWQATADAEALLQTWPEKQSPWYLVHLQELHFQWALLMGASQRVAEALEHIEQGLLAAEATARPASTVRFAALASHQCECAGRFQEALRWLRRSVAAQRQVKKEQAAKLAMVSRIRLETDTLRQELQASRLNAMAVEQQNRRLTERLGVYERYGLTDAEGFVASPGFLAALQVRHDEAVAHDLPCCVAVLQLRGGQNPEAARERLRFVDGAVRRALSLPMLAVCRWSEGCLVFLLEGMGARRAGAVCTELQKSIGHELAKAFEGAVDCALRAQALDLAGHDHFDEALAALEQAAAG